MALLALLAASGCDDSSSRPRLVPPKPSLLDTAAKATANAGGTARGSIDLGSGHGAYQVHWKGALSTGLGVATGTLPGAVAPVPLDARWRGGQVYFRRTAKAEDFGTSPIGQLVGLQPGSAIWSTGSATSVSTRIFGIFSPPDLALALASSGKEKVTTGPTIDGHATRLVTVTGHLGLLFNWVGSKRAEVLIDERNLVRRATVHYGNERVRLDVAYSSAEPKVAAPPAKELEQKAPPPIAPIGPFRTARAGNDLGVVWALQRAPAPDGAACWRWTSTPALEVVKPNFSTDTRCPPPVGAGADITDRIEFVLWTDGTKSNVAAVVAVVPSDITQATLGFVGGRTAPATITDGLLTWVGSSDEPLGYVGLVSGTTTINCGIGAVSTPADLTNDQLVGNPFGSAWLCQT